MLTPDLIARIRNIFLQDASFVSIPLAAELLGWSEEQLRQAAETKEIELTTVCSGAAVPRDELIALAVELWPVEWIEEALGRRAARVLPEAIRSRTLAARLPRYQAAMLAYLAEKQGTTTGHLIALALDDLVSEHFDTLTAAIPGFAEAVAWPNLDETHELS